MSNSLLFNNVALFTCPKVSWWSNLITVHYCIRILMVHWVGSILGNQVSCLFQSWKKKKKQAFVRLYWSSSAIYQYASSEGHETFKIIGRGQTLAEGWEWGTTEKKGGGAKIKRQGWGLQNYRGWGLYPPILPHCDVLNSWNILQFKLLKQYSERSFGVLFCSCSSRLPRNITNVNKPVKESYSAQTCQGKLLCPAS